MGNDEIDEFKRVATITNSRGHAGAFAKETREDQASLEKVVAQEWARSARLELGLTVSSVRHNPCDPPDCFAEISGQVRAIELTEFVNEELLDEIATFNEENGCRATSSDHFYHEAQWSVEAFKEGLVRRIDKKQEKYKRRGVVIDVLVIHCDEPWLHPLQVEAWLSSISFDPRPNLFSVHFLQFYVPGYREYWPIFKLY